MVKIRLRRVGAKKQPSYRIVVVDSRAPRQGAYVEAIGFYNPLTQPATITVDEEKALLWLRRGAQPTETVEHLLRRSGVAAKFQAERPARAMGMPEARPPADEAGEAAAASVE